MHKHPKLSGFVLLSFKCKKAEVYKEIDDKDQLICVWGKTVY
jgi:hypothetical protein